MSQPPMFHRREIWWCCVGINIGHEQGGRDMNFERPVVVVNKFNREICLIIPFSSSIKIGAYYYPHDHKGKKNCIILSQIRLISSIRLLRKIGVMDKSHFLIMRDKLKQIL